MNFTQEQKEDKTFIILEKIKELDSDRTDYDQLIGYLTAFYDVQLFSKEEVHHFEYLAKKAMGYEVAKWSDVTDSVNISWELEHQPKLVIGGIVIPD